MQNTDILIDCIFVKQISKNSKIGIVLSPYWFEPYDIASNADKEAVERALAFNIGW